MLKYGIWIVAWVITQRLMMLIGVIDSEKLVSTFGTAIFSVIMILIFRRSKLIILIASVLIIIWVAITLGSGNIINALVGGVMNAWLILMATKEESH